MSLHDYGFLGPLGPELHGSRKSYAAGCRCLPCRSAESCYQAMRARARAMGQSGWVDATPSRQHVAYLLSKGIGLHQIAAASGVSFRTVQAIKHGRPRVTKQIERRLLTTRAIPALGAHITRYNTSRLVRALLSDGYDPAHLQALGLPPAAFAFDHASITVKTAALVRALWRKLTSDSVGLRS